MTLLKMPFIVRFFTLAIVFLMLSACGSVKKTIVVSGSDAAPTDTIDVSKIPNAVPKHEPKSRYGNPKSYVVFGKRYYVMESNAGFVEKGIASWYGTKFHGRRTSSGETYDMYAMTAAHKNLPLPTYVKVTNLKNGKHIIVKVNDRGPFHENRIIDLSYTAAIKLDIVKYGTGLVEVRVVQPGQVNEQQLDNGPVAPVFTADSDSNYDNMLDFYIQVGAFFQRDNAEKRKKKLSPLASHKVSVNQVISSGARVYRVRIGPITDIQTADSIITQLKQLGVLEHQIVTN